MFDFERRISRIQERLKENELDALVVAVIEGNNKNVYYLSGFAGTAGLLAISRDDAVLAVDGRYTLRAANEAKGVRVVRSDVSDRRITAFTNYLTPALLALGLAREARIALEGERISVSMLEKWRAVTDVTFVPTSWYVETLRQCKDEQEIKKLEEACRITCAVYEECSAQVHPGMTEFEVGQLFDTTLRKRGALSNSFQTIVASGPNSACPHHETSGRMIEAGEPVTIDFGGLFPGGYCSDLTRTLFAPGDTPDTKMVEIYRIVLEANRAAFNALAIGMTWKEYDTAAREVITKHGYGEYFTHGLGHSLGLEAHDPYNYADAPFGEGMVITDEPGIYVPNLGGVRIEDDLVVTKDGARSLTPAPYLSL